MSEYQILSVLAGFAFLYSLVAARLERTPINGALVYVVVGVLCGPAVFKLVDLNVDADGISWLAELTLAVVLFTDSAKADIKTLRRFEAIPVRLLLIGLPLTIGLGFATGLLLFHDLTLFELALLATMLAPTDAALGKAVVTNQLVPSSVRESLNVESGLNDGICVPIVLLFLALAGGEASGWQAVSLVVLLPLQAIGIGTVVGAALGLGGSLALHASRQREWISGAWTQIPVIALALLCFGLSQWLGGSGFIACFVAGMTFGAWANPQHKETVLEAAEGSGDALSMLTWFTFGTMLLAPPFLAFDWRIFVYAIASLTIIRMVPVVLCVMGCGLGTGTKLFLGWFGPRGLASIVFAVMIIHHKIPGGDTLVSAAAMTIVLSVFAHGLSANPLAMAYSTHVRESGL